VAETYVYGSRIKSLAKEAEVRMGGDALTAINTKIEAMVKLAADRAKGNKRKTIMPFDL
jgi:histone H3/H4